MFSRSTAVRVFFWIVLASLIPWSQSQAVEFFVKQGPGSSDQNPGTAKQPLRTISAAAARVKAGDKVIIYGGEYREFVMIKASGTPNAAITFEAAPGETPVIKGSELVRGWERTSNNVWKAKLPALPPRSNDKNDPSFWQTNDVRQVFAKDGVLLDAIHLRPSVIDQLAEGNFVCDPTKNELYIWLSQREGPNSLTIEASMRTGWLSITGSNIVIRGLQMRHSSTLGISNGPACSLSGNNIVLQNCTLTWADFVAVSFGGNNGKLLGCTVACNGNSGINGKGEGHIVEGCRVLYNNIDRYYFGWHCGGAKFIPQFCRGRIVRSEFAYNIGPGLWLDDRCNDNLVEGNLCHDNEGPGIEVEASANNRVFNNICFSNRNPLAGEFLEPDESSNEGNRFRRLSRGGKDAAQFPYHAGEGRGIYVSSSPGSRVYHNTCYLNEGEGICVESPLRGEMSTRDVSVLNNITAYNKGTQLVMRRNGKDAHTHDNQSDYNLLMTLGAVFATPGWDGPFASSLKEWQKSTGNDKHSVEADPAFAMAAMGDFRLLPMSAGARRGQPLDDVRNDFFGSPRPKSKVSIGACEVTAFDYPRPTAPYLQVPFSQ